MNTITKTAITVEATVKAPVEKVWRKWTSTDAITKWNAASPDWHSPKAEHDLQPGGKFNYRMEARDGSFGFDFTGTFDVIKPNEYLETTLDDGRKVKTTFTSKGDETHISETFEAEEVNSVELQKGGWQAILDSFKAYVESLNDLMRFHYEIHINAPARKVYDLMLDKEHYQTWTAPFSPTSTFEGSWEKGSKIKFIGTDENGETGGMVSTIEENIPGEFLSIRHLGLMKGEEEITSGPEVEGWGQALENYTYKADNGGTLLLIDLDGIKEFQDFFAATWPLALNKIKEIAEK